MLSLQFIRYSVAGATAGAAGVEARDARAKPRTAARGAKVGGYGSTRSGKMGGSGKGEVDAASSSCPLLFSLGWVSPLGPMLPVDDKGDQAYRHLLIYANQPPPAAPTAAAATTNPTAGTATAASSLPSAVEGAAEAPAVEKGKRAVEKGEKVADKGGEEVAEAVATPDVQGAGVAVKKGCEEGGGEKGGMESELGPSNVTGTASAPASATTVLDERHSERLADC